MHLLRGPVDLPDRGRHRNKLHCKDPITGKEKLTIPIKLTNLLPSAVDFVLF